MKRDEESVLHNWYGGIGRGTEEEEKYTRYGLTPPDGEDTLCSRCGIKYWHHNGSNGKMDISYGIVMGGGPCKGFKYVTFESMVSKL